MPGGFNFANMGGGAPGGGGTRTYRFSTGPGGAGTFNFSNPEDIFKNFAKSGGGGMGFGDDNDIFAELLGAGLGGAGARGARASAGGGGGPGATFGARRDPTPEPQVVEKPLNLTLEEIFNGTTKKVTTKSKTFDASGRRSVQDITLEAKIKPGLRTGSKLKYKGVGDQEEGGRQDVHLVVTEVWAPPLTPLTYHPIGIGNANDPIERTSNPQTKRRPPHNNSRPNPQRSPNRLGTHRQDHRRKINPSLKTRSHTTRLRRTIPRIGYANLQETKRKGRYGG